MNPLLGIVGIGLTLVFFTWAVDAFRRPVPAAWTRSEAAAVAVSLAVTIGFSFSVAWLLRFAAEMETLATDFGAGWITAAAAVFAVALLGLIFRRAFAGRRQGAGSHSPTPKPRSGRPVDARPMGPTGAGRRRVA